MPRKWTISLMLVALIGAAAVAALGQGLPEDLKGKVDAKVAVLKPLGSDPTVIAAVKAYNTTPPPEALAMTNDKWKTLTVLDPFVRGYSKNALAVYLKGKLDPAVTEAFVSGADGGKVAFLSKTTYWSHKGKEKHMAPMAGKIYYGPVEVDESTGLQAIQIGIPVTDGGHPIGSMVLGLSIAKLK